MRALLIGGTRFIGPHVARQLVAAEHNVTVFHRGEHEPELPSAVRHVHSPAAAVPIVEFPPELFAPAPDVVIHMIAMGEADTRRFMAAFRGRAAHAIIISSGDVYRAYGRLTRAEPGPVEPVPLGEDAPLRSVHYLYRKAFPADSWQYDYEKIVVEQIAHSEPQLPATVLRLPKVFGRGDGGHMALAARIAEFAPSWRWTHGYVENVAAAIVLAATSATAAGKIYNVGEEHTPTLSERLRGWNVAAVPELPMADVANWEFKQDIVYDTSRIRRELGYRELVSNDEAMRRTVSA